MIAFIDDHREAHGIEPICKVLPIVPSTYHDHLAKGADPVKLSARAWQDMALKPDISRVFAENVEVYGLRKVWRQMHREGFSIARCTVERLMQGMELQGVIVASQPKPRFRTTRCRARWIMLTGSSEHQPRTSCGFRILPTSPVGQALSMWPS
jgi:hypothetical protein